MEKFKIDATRTDEYEVMVDPDIWTPEAIADWAKSFYPADEPEDIAKYAAESIMNRGTDPGIIEGFGYLKLLRPDGSVITQFGGDPYRALTDSDYTAGIVVKVIAHNEYIDMDVTVL